MRPMQVTGLNGLTLAEAWAEEPRAHRTTTLPGFPNFFLLLGPNTPIHISLVPVAESQAGFVLHWVRRIMAGKVRHVAPTVEATATFNAAVRANMGRTTFAAGCDSWYIGPDGHPVVWPFAADEFHAMLANPDDSEYDIQTPVTAMVPG